MKFRLAGLLLATVSTSAFALDWAATELPLKTSPLQRTAETAFAFTNRSDRTVTIVGIDTSCDCTEALPSAQTFAPGASGLIKARFHLGDRTGTYERFISVTTDEAKDPIRLTVRLEVPELATLTPRSVEWKLNGPAWEKTIDIQIADGLELEVTTVLPTSGLFNQRLETVEPGRHYRLFLSPQSTKEVSNAAFRIYAKSRDGQDIVVSAYGNVR